MSVFLTEEEIINLNGLKTLELEVPYNAIRYIPQILENNKNISLFIKDNINAHEFQNILDIFNIYGNDMIDISFGAVNSFSGIKYRTIYIVLSNGSIIDFYANYEHLNKFNFSLILNLATNLKKIRVYDCLSESGLANLIFENKYITFPDTLKSVCITDIQDTKMMEIIIKKIKSLEEIIYICRNVYKDLDNISEFKQENNYVKMINQPEILN